MWIGRYTMVEVTGVNRVLLSDTKRRTFEVHNRLKLFIYLQIDMRLKALQFLSVTCVATDYTQELCGPARIVL
jgi:hypothetical protein